ncbi:Metallo-dependent phosphatase-like protein [Irpex rosettiformis]|uniref:Metallo-dependent phosphatase-like protein n=1 Tax=Irpex rosettiformis TaxID=378272 RepID=A0ACB8UFY7_9APHY|nr:Metallo-dependent phosphatase-like protein [Irpex rosettiformis]
MPALALKDISLLNWLRILWVLVVFWYEYGLFKYRLAYCKWGDKQPAKSTVNPHHVLLLTDPQVRTLSTIGRGFLGSLRLWVYHESLKKNWAYAKSLRPDSIVFLGDILHAGQKIERDDEYMEAVSHFLQIFSTREETDLYFVPGNEDVGLDLLASSTPQARDRYFKYFGHANRKVSISKHTFVFLDAPLLVEEDYHRAKMHKGYEEWKAGDDGSVEFIRSFRGNDTDPQQPVILFSHIPLYRPDTASCGPLREYGTIHRGAGPGYQNTLGKLTTEFIFEHISPSLVFSGDDRDYCEYTHESQHTSQPVHIREVTVKSFSPFKDIRHPGFHLLSLTPPDAQSTSAKRTFIDSPCFLPDQTSTYTSVYFPLSAITLLVLAIITLRKPHGRYTSLLPSTSPVSYRSRRSRSPPKRPTADRRISWTFSLSSPPSTPLASPWSRTRKESRLSITLDKIDLGRYTPSHSPAYRALQVLLGVFVSFGSAILPAVVLWTFIAWTSG